MVEEKAPPDTEAEDAASVAEGEPAPELTEDEDSDATEDKAKHRRARLAVLREIKKTGVYWPGGGGSGGRF